MLVWDAGGVDDVTWGVLTVALTLLGGIWTWYAYQRRGLAAALKGAGITLLPLAAYFTKTLRMFTRIGDAIADWATSLVFSPLVWLGVIITGVAAVLFGAGRMLEQRSGAPQPRGKKPKFKKQREALAPGSPQRGEPAIDDDLADIEALLRKRGIT